MRLINAKKIRNGWEISEAEISENAKEQKNIIWETVAVIFV